MKKLLILFLIFTVITARKVEAATMVLQHVPTTVAQQQQFYVDVAIDPQGKSLNGIQGSVVFSDDTLSFVRAETGSSNVTLFIDQPTVKGNTITYSGIIPGGFNGLIDPFDPTHTLPGQIVRLVFVGKTAGEAQIIATGTSITDNDGKGTLETVPDQSSFLSVSTTVAPSIYNIADTTPPTLTASVVTDSELYNGKYALLFTATDKQSGVDHVEIKEGRGAWHTIQSPYVLQDQSRDSILLVRAYDAVGNTTVITINPLAQKHQSTVFILIAILIAALFIFYVIKKKFL